MCSRVGVRSTRATNGLIGLVGLVGAACAPATVPPWAAYPVPDSTKQQIAEAAVVAATHATHEQARRHGFIRIAPESLTDLNPFQGEHWISDRAIRLPFDLTRPSYIMYYPLGDVPQQLVGVAYARLEPTGSPMPEGFHGDDDRWHVHLPCHDVPGLGYVLAFSASDCNEFGGTPGPMRIAMVHLWTDVPNPDGPFAMNNPALPFLASGLRVPPDAEFRDPVRSPFLRKLGLALGETYGGVPRMGARIAQRPDSVFADAVRPTRNAIRVLLPDLTAAQNANDAARFDAIAREMIAYWRTIRDAYLDAASAPAHRMLLEQWFATATAPPQAVHNH